jgi:hypothetical protein
MDTLEASFQPGNYTHSESDYEEDPEDTQTNTEAALEQHLGIEDDNDQEEVIVDDKELKSNQVKEDNEEEDNNSIYNEEEEEGDEDKVNTSSRQISHEMPSSTQPSQSYGYSSYHGDCIVDSIATL